RAVDGDVVADIERQLAAKPVEKPCTFVLSVGGNDALGHVGLLEDTSTNRSVHTVLLEFAAAREEFRTRYTGSIDAIMEHGQPLIICTIYNPQFPDPVLQRLAETALSFFNDVITEEALRRRLPVIDLRDVCSDPAAFANSIEPSEHGGDLITNAIIEHLQG
ncbi:MAG: SGNH/GDSL hydrolase family protein, partial [Alphaproteobacteria bacterium]|nr:SGNH/GDSL hydrolase family protein [Alphaproteobacteria bacterium]